MSQPANDKSKRATLNDIAVKAGVSVSTVSLVLSNKTKERRISDEVHWRVQQAAQELDYAPNLLVRSMQRGRTHVLSFFNGFRYRPPNDLYMDHLFAAIERTAGERGYDILLHCDFRRSAEDTYQLLNGGRADGLILFAPQENDPLLPYLRDSRLPTVLINHCDRAKRLAGVSDDMNAGMKQVAERLLTSGHRRIAALTPLPGKHYDAEARIPALRRYFAERNVFIADDWIRPASDYAECEAAMRFLMACSPAPTALVCWNDYVGYLALDLCAAWNVRVPEQLSLVGYDGLCWPTMTRHTLNSVQVDLDSLARCAVTTLIDQIEGKEVGAHRFLPVQMLTGTTLAAPADA